MDIGGHPPIPLGPPPLLLSVFQFPHSLLFLAVFRVLNFRSRFESLNDIFLGKKGETCILIHCFSPKICSPRIDLSNELSSAPNGDCMQKLHPSKVDVSTTPIGDHKIFGFSSSEVRVLDFLYFKKAFRASL